MTADTIGGVWTYALDLARGLAPLGHTVTLATMGALLSPDQWAEARGVANLDVRESGYKLEWMDDPWSDVTDAGNWLLGLEREVQPDLIHLNGFAHGALPWRAPTLVVAHSCVLSWWRAVRGEDAPNAIWSRYEVEVRTGLRAANAVVAPTHAMANALNAAYGPLPAAVTVIPNGRDGANLLIDLAVKEPFILTAGRLWDDAKNVRALAAVAPRLPWPVYVAGDVAEPGVDKQETANDTPCLRSLGRLSPSALAGWMSRAAIYALPARYEPFGLSALEAAQHGRALVLGGISSLREVWGDAALFVPPADTVALEAVLVQLIENPAERERFADSAAARARRYTVRRMAGGYQRLYCALAHPFCPPRPPKNGLLALHSA